MYKRYDGESDVPPMIYRSSREIREEMRVIREKIERVSEKVNIRSLLIDIISDKRQREPQALIPELYRAIEEAEEALLTLKELREELSALEEELRITICEIGI